MNKNKNHCFLGAGPLKEWVSLEGEGDKPPRIRAARSLTSFHNEGTRKRPRADMVDYWSIGDNVDAWIQERYFIFYFFTLYKKYKLLF